MMDPACTISALAIILTDRSSHAFIPWPDSDENSNHISQLLNMTLIDRPLYALCTSLPRQQKIHPDLCRTTCTKGHRPVSKANTLFHQLPVCIEHKLRLEVGQRTVEVGGGGR